MSSHSFANMSGMSYGERSATLTGRYLDRVAYLGRHHSGGYRKFAQNMFLYGMSFLLGLSVITAYERTKTLISSQDDIVWVRVVSLSFIAMTLGYSVIVRSWE